MHRHVSAHLEIQVNAPATLALQVAVATTAGTQSFLASSEDVPVPWRIVAAPHGGRIHVVDAPPGLLLVDYTADVRGAVPVPGGDEHDQLVYRRPSRYCPSDRFTATASGEFGWISDQPRFFTDVTNWVQQRMVYAPGVSGPTDDAVDALLKRTGVCRDYAQIVVSLLRARNVPARLAAVYAPGLSPMDFHVVAEAWDEGAWWVLDATGLAPRQSMLRIATGRDAADTAFLSVIDGLAELTGMQVSAVVDELPLDDPGALVALI